MAGPINVDIFVAGLGPGGASAAAIAAQGGLTVFGVDKKRVVGRPVQCAEFIPLPLGGHAREPGVRVQAITGMKSFLPSAMAVATDFPGLMIDRAAFDSAIVERATAAGAALHFDTRLLALDTKRRVAVVEGPDGRAEIGYRILVAADGPSSRVAECMGLPRLATVNTRQYTVPLVAPYADTDIWLSDDYAGGYAWLFPKGEVANLGLGADKRFADDLKAPLDHLHRQLVAEGRVGERILARTGGLIPVGGLRSQLVEDRVLFVGDAAGLTHPITGAGIAAAVVSGERAGEAAADFLAGDDATALADFEEDIRDQYEETLNRAVQRRAWLNTVWRTPAAQRDEVMRRGWIAFDEYFATYDGVQQPAHLEEL